MKESSKLGIAKFNEQGYSKGAFGSITAKLELKKINYRYIGSQN